MSARDYNGVPWTVLAATHALGMKSRGSTTRDILDNGTLNYLVAPLMGMLLGGALVLLHPGTYLRFSISAALGCCVLGLNVGLGNMVLLGDGRIRQNQRFAPAVMASLAFGIMVVHDCVSVGAISGGTSGLLAGLVKLLEFVAIALAGLPWLLIGRERLGLASVALGLATYCGINVFAYKGLGMAGVTSGTMEESWSILDGVRVERMIAPFSDGLNNFGMFAAMGFSLCMMLLVDWRVLREKVLSLALICGMVVCFYACILVQMRSAAIMAAAALAWIVLARRGIAVTYLWVSLCVFLGGAWAYMGAYRFGIADALVGVLPGFMTRTGEQLSSLSGRVLIWDYALSLLASGQIPLLGLGVAVRDTTPAFALSGAMVGESGMTCHNGFLDLLCVYGPIISGLAGILMAGIIARLTWVDPDRARNWRSVRHGLLALILWAGATEAVSGSALFWALCLLCALGPGAAMRPLR